MRACTRSLDGQHFLQIITRQLKKKSIALTPTTVIILISEKGSAESNFRPVMGLCVKD